MPNIFSLFKLDDHNRLVFPQEELGAANSFAFAACSWTVQPVILACTHSRISMFCIGTWRLSRDVTTFKRSSGAGGKSVVRGSCRHHFGVIPIFLGPICPTSPSTHEVRNTRVHCERRQQRLLVQLYILSGTFSYLFGEMSITQCIQSLARTTSIQATEGQFVSLLRYWDILADTVSG